jgi:serine/threonine protein kinase
MKRDKNKTKELYDQGKFLYCDMCLHTIEVGESTYRCDTCDFDHCKYCSSYGIRQLRDRRPSDIWSLGITFYKMLTGKYLFQSMDEAMDLKYDLSLIQN